MEKMISSISLLVIISLLVGMRSYIISRRVRGGVPKIMDVMEFCGMRRDVLIGKLGVPDVIREFGYEHKGLRYKAKIYGYKGPHGYHYEYSTVDGVVTRVRIYSRMYYGCDYPDIAFSRPDDLFYMMGITPHRKMKLVGKSPVALRYEWVSDSVFELYANGVGMDEGKAFMICVSFDERYTSLVASDCSKTA